MGIDAPEPDFTREKGHDWFLRQDEATQRGMMKGLYDPWRDGQFTLGDIPKLVKSDVWGNSWTPKTLQELLTEARIRPTGIPISDALDLSGFPSARSKLGSSVREAIEAIDSVHGDGPLPTIPVQRNRTYSGKRSRNAAFVKRRGIADSIQIHPQSGQPAISVTHEIGHFIDHQNAPSGSRHLSWDDTNRYVRDWHNAVTNSAEFKRLQSALGAGTQEVTLPKGTKVTYQVDRKFVSYLLQRDELFARSYAQYITVRSESIPLAEELDYFQERAQHPQHYALQWQANEFGPIAKTLDALFGSMGWLQ